MRSLLSIIILLVACSCAQKNNDDIVVNFKVHNMTYSRIALVNETMVEEMDLDKNGETSCTLQGDYIFAHLFYGEEAKNVFLQKGDRVTITFDANQFKDGIQFEGKNAPVIDYLNTLTYTPINPPDYMRSWDDMLRFVNEKIDGATTLLKARKLEAVNPEFVKLEEGRIKYSYLSNLIIYPMAYTMQDTTYRPGDDYYSTLEQFMQEDESLMNLLVYREYLTEAALVLAARDHQYTNAYDRNVAKMKYLAGQLKNDKIKQSLLNEIAVKYITRNGIQHITDMENIHHTYVTDPALRAAYKTEYDKWNIAVPGKPSPDFQAKDVDGKTYSLKDFKGKYLYIDMWATWCGPCKRDIPHLKELEKKMEGKNITFLGLSTDTDKAAWEKMAKSGTLSGVQLLLGKGSQFQRDYNINGIPHFILIDPQGNIVNPQAVRPSSPDAEKILNALPGIK